MSPRASPVTGVNSSPPDSSHLAQLRRKVSATATAIARTEDKIASTFDHIARNRPDAAKRLRAKATEARRCAARLRYLATQYDDGPSAVSNDGRL